MVVSRTAKVQGFYPTWKLICQLSAYHTRLLEAETKNFITLISLSILFPPQEPWGQSWTATRSENWAYVTAEDPWI